MPRRPTPPQAPGQPVLERAGLRALLARPLVQLLLLAVAGGQLAATRAERRSASEALPRLPVAVVQPSRAAEGAHGSEVTHLWQERVVERESRRLAGKYRSEGYRIPLSLAHSISEAALENGIDPELAFGLVRAESSFRNSATSHVGAVGLTQLMPSTARWMEPGTSRRELRDPETNLRIGFKYLRYLLDKYDGDTRLALLAYNRGPGTVDRVLRRGGDPDNGYVEMVLGD